MPTELEHAKSLIDGAAQPEETPLLTTPQKFWLGSAAGGMALTGIGTFGLSGLYQAMIAVGSTLIVLGVGGLGFSSMRSNTNTGGR